MMRRSATKPTPPVSETIMQKSIPVPTLEETRPAYGNMLQRRLELLDRRSDLESQMQKIRRGKVPSHLTEEAVAERSARAAGLVSDVVSGASSYRIASPTPAAVAAHYEGLRTDLEAVAGALSILEAEIPAAQREANDAVLDVVRPDYNALLRELAIAVAKTAALHDIYAALTDDMNRSDVRWLGKLAQPASLRAVFGDASDRDTPARRFVENCIASGIVARHEVVASSTTA